MKRPKPVIIIILATIVSASIIIPLLILYPTPNNGTPAILPYIARFENSSVNCTYGLGYLSGEVEIDGANISMNYYNSTLCNNITSVQFSWNTISIFNDVNLTITSIDRTIYIYAFDTSSVHMKDINASYEIYFNLNDEAKISLENCTAPRIDCYFSDSASGTIDNCTLYAVNMNVKSMVSLTSSDAWVVSSADQSNLTITNCSINILSNGVYILSGALVIAGSALLGTIFNTTNIYNSSVNIHWVSVDAYGTTTVDLQSYSGDLLIRLRDASSCMADGVSGNKIQIYGTDSASISVNNCTLLTVVVGGRSTAIINNSILSSAIAYPYSNLTIYNTTVNTLIYSIYYSTGTLTFQDDILPPGYINCCTLIDTTPTTKQLLYIYLRGGLSATFTGNITHNWWFWAYEGTIMNIQTLIMTQGGFFYLDNSYGVAVNSTVSTIINSGKGLVTINDISAYFVGGYSLHSNLVITGQSQVNSGNVRYFPPQ